MMNPKLLDSALSIVSKKLKLNIHALGTSGIVHALSVRLRTTGLSQNEYEKILCETSLEQDELCQLLLVSESWFLREDEPIKDVLSFLKGKKKSLRILSTPCARGEEGVTALYHAIKSGFNSSEIIVDGYDASINAITQAKEFIFSNYSHRVMNKDFENQFLDFSGSFYRLKEKWQDCFFYKEANLLDSQWAPRLLKYDVILCRNLLIYLRPKSQHHLIETLTKYLADDGILIVSSSEAALLSGSILKRHDSSILAFHKLEVETKLVSQSITSKVSVEKRKDLPQKIQKNNKVSSRIDSIQFLANRGHLQEAIAEAHGLSRMFPGSPEVLFILGVLASICGNLDEARSFMKKVLEIDPAHEDAQLYFDWIWNEEKYS